MKSVPHPNNQNQDLPPINAAMQAVLTTAANQLARPTGFTQRQTHLHGSDFVRLLVLSWLKNPQIPLEEMAQFGSHLGIQITAQAIHERWNKQTAAFLKAVFEVALTQVVVANPVAVPLLARFGAVVVEDSTLLFPHRVRTGPHAGTIHWSALTHNGVLKILRNTRYAGAFCYGRTHTSKGLDGSLHVEIVPQEDWPFLFQDVHVGYITWQEFEANRKQLQQNRQAFGGDRKHGPAREGPALLQGLVICGKCGNRMTVRYHQAEHGTRLIPEYVCQKERIEHASEQTCQHILGAGLDTTIAELLLAQMTPFTLETAQQVYEEMHAQAVIATDPHDTRWHACL